MRKGSQSMYQPKNTGGSSKFIGNVQGGSMLKSMAPQRKMQGHDNMKTTKTNFENTVSNLKNKPNKKVLEDQYIKGLQQEIKYLEYQLKLLKDKEILQREGVNELDNFLKDEIPINENILAMKNKYNATKNTLEDQLRKLMAKQAQANDVLTSQKNDINRLHELIDTHRQQIYNRRRQFKQKVSELVKQLTLTKEEHQATLRDNREKQQELKKMSEQVANIQRANEKQKVQEVRASQEKAKFMEKFNEKFRDTKANMIESTQQIEQMQQRGQVNPLLDPLQQENSNLRKRIMLNEKQKSTADNIIAEIELFLKEEARDREIERQHKAKYLNQTDDYKTQLQHLERYAQNLIKDQTARTKKLMLKQMHCDLNHKQANYNMLVDRLRNLEQQCSNLIQEKKELQDALQSEDQLLKQLASKKSTLQSSITNNKSQANSLKRVTDQSCKEVIPLQNDLQKCSGMIPIVEKEIDKKKNMIHHLNKQVDLLKQLKALDLEQLAMISQGGNHVQNILHSFIKNWEKIRSK